MGMGSFNLILNITICPVLHNCSLSKAVVQYWLCYVVVPDRSLMHIFMQRSPGHFQNACVLLILCNSCDVIAVISGLGEKGFIFFNFRHKIIQQRNNLQMLCENTFAVQPYCIYVNNHRLYV